MARLPKIVLKQIKKIYFTKIITYQLYHFETMFVYVYQKSNNWNCVLAIRIVKSVREVFNTIPAFPKSFNDVFNKKGKIISLEVFSYWMYHLWERHTSFNKVYHLKLNLRTKFTFTAYP